MWFADRSRVPQKFSFMAKSYSASADLRLLDPFWRERVDRVVLPNGLVAAWDLAWWGSHALAAADRRL